MKNETLDSTDSLSPNDFLGRLFQGLRTAIQEFQNEATPENFAKLVSVVGAYGATSSKLWSGLARFARKHPIQSAVGAGVLFFAARKILGRVPGTQQTSEWRAQNYH